MTLRSSVRTDSHVLPSSTVVRRLDVLKLPADATVTTACEGRCPFRRRTRRLSLPTARLRLQPLFGDAHLRVGTVIEIRITAPETIGTLVRYTVRGGKARSSRTLCLPPGAARTEDVLI